MADNDAGISDVAPRPKLQRVVDVRLPTVYGEFLAVGYLDPRHGQEQIALVHGPTGHGVPLARVHSECLTGDVLGSLHCECGDQLSASLRAIVAAGSGILVYVQGHEGRGIGLLAKLKAMRLQTEGGLDTVEANRALGLPVDARDYGVAADILHDLGVRSVRLLSNNPGKSEALQQHGIAVVEQMPLLVDANHENVRYLRAKRELLDHHLPQLDHLAAELLHSASSSPVTAPAATDPAVAET